ncbi:hypothetical protein BT96DRAFT_943255 [Gymnopus androsaceus JB14]|uniref:Uncharacterized protein n=1 Tax=Gymnopus androsaceus JB14 TaxID=1447944 RepID=A0A6A4H9D9_9AGAR|nr:hypothetical protein BT96DRAFT_943255 [Gymnopus androsaceus JB14]
MFSKTLIFATAVLPAALGAIVFNTPTNVTSGLVSNITWTADDTDPTFSLELNHPSFSNSIAIGNNIDPTLETLSIEWPIVPADVDYSLSAVNIGNISNIFAQSSDFAIAQAPTTASATFSTTFAVSSSGTGSASALIFFLAQPEVASGTGSASSGIPDDCYVPVWVGYSNFQ